MKERVSKFIGIKNIVRIGNIPHIKKIYYKYHKFNPNKKANDDSFFDISKFIDIDYIVFSGCILNDYFIRFFTDLLIYMKNKDVKIIFNGAGGSFYSKKENEMVINFIKYIKPYAIITRDKLTYNTYEPYIQNIYDGIDCGFFISDYYKPFKLNKKYDVHTFDKRNIDISSDNLIVNAHHGLLDNKKEIYSKSNVFISERPEDYLNLYGNAMEIHSDRIHACVPGLVYGVPCKFYHETPRVGLFDRVGLTHIREKIQRIDMYKLNKEKNGHKKYLSEIIH